jgi:hypothetical protein
MNKPRKNITPEAQTVIDEIAAGLPSERYSVMRSDDKGYVLFDRVTGSIVTEGRPAKGYFFAVDAQDAANELNAPEPGTWMAVRQTPAFAVAVDIARQERNSQIRLDQARAKLAAIESECEDGYEAGDMFNAARAAHRNDNNVLWGAARMLAAMVDNDDELGALQVLRSVLDAQDGHVTV